MSLPKPFVIVLAEEHSNPQITERLTVVLENDVIKDIPRDKILNFTEGKETANFFKILYQKKNNKKPKNMVEISDALLEREPLFHCLIYFHTFLFMIKNYIDFIKETVDRGENINQYNGFHYHKFDKEYMLKMIEIYDFNKFINVDNNTKQEKMNTKTSFYSWLNTCYINALEQRENYEENLKKLLEVSKEHFGKCDGYENTIFTNIIDEIISTNSIDERKPILDKYLDIFRKIRDKKMIEKIKNYIISNPSLQLQMIIIYVGGNHYKNIKNLVQENSIIQLSPFQDYLDIAFRSFITE
jgi:hypothetical protein